MADPEPVPDTCRCGHPRRSHGVGGRNCVYATSAGRGCGCGEFVDENPIMTARRNESLHELLEHVATLDRHYRRLPLPPWASS